MQNGPKKNPVAAIFLTVFLDLLALSIAIPVMAPLIVDNLTGIMPAGMDIETRQIIYGFVIGSYPVALFFGAPVLGALSDRFGRRRILLIALAGTMIGHMLFATGIEMSLLWLLFASRLADGFTGGNLAIIYSAMSDVSTPENRTRNFGLIGVAFGTGFILGPFFGGILADPEMVSWFSPAVPFYFMTALSLINIIIVIFNFPETLKSGNNKSINPFQGFINLKKAFTAANLRPVFSVVFLHSLGFAFFTQFFQVFLIRQFNYNIRDIGNLFFFIGLWIVFTQGVLIRPLTARFDSRQILSVSLFSLACVLCVILLPENDLYLYFLIPFVAISHGLTTPNMTNVVSQQATAQQQGEIMGIQQSFSSAGLAIPPILAGFLSTFSKYAPTLTGAALIFIGWAIFTFIFRKRFSKSAS